MSLPSRGLTGSAESQGAVAISACQRARRRFMAWVCSLLYSNRELIIRSRSQPLTTPSWQLLIRSQGCNSLISALRFASGIAKHVLPATVLRPNVSRLSGH